ncbi:MAG: trimeric intracellular cation channel family protein [Solirubrobacteraceae bacterium]
MQLLDAAGLGVFCVTGATTALDHRLGVAEAIILGVVTGIGGGMLRDVLLRQIPTVLRSELYAVPALIGAGILVGGHATGSRSALFPILGAVVCFAIRVAGMRFGLEFPIAHSERRAQPPPE